MSIIIHGIDMPKRKYDVLLVKIFPNGGINWWNAYGGSEIARTQKRRAEQLPPHGRLIDAEALVIDMSFVRDFYDYSECYYGYSRNTVECAPTIIEAEGERE